VHAKLHRYWSLRVHAPRLRSTGRMSQEPALANITPSNVEGLSTEQTTEVPELTHVAVKDTIMAG
jgi:hypothetical protein